MPEKPLPLIASALADLIIGLIRWSQLLPMLYVGAFLLLMLAAMTVVNFQDQAVVAAGMLEPLIAWLDRLPLINIRGWLEGLADENGRIHFGGEDLKTVIGRLFVVSSILLYVLAALLNWLFGPFPRWSFGRKMKLVTVAACFVSAGFFVNYFLGGEQYNGAIGGWIALFIGLPLAWVVVSAYSLGISTTLQRVSDAIRGSGSTQQVSSSDR